MADRKIIVTIRQQEKSGSAKFSLLVFILTFLFGPLALILNRSKGIWYKTPVFFDDRSFIFPKELFKDNIERVLGLSSINKVTVISDNIIFKPSKVIFDSYTESKFFISGYPDDLKSLVEFFENRGFLIERKRSKVVILVLFLIFSPFIVMIILAILSDMGLV